MVRRGAPKGVRHMEDLPDDVSSFILSKLDFEDKIIAGQVCKSWDRLLKAPIAGARHWAINYDIDEMVASGAFTTTEQVPLVEEFNATTGRWLVNRAAAIKEVHVTATLSDDEHGVVTRKVLESQLPLVVGSLTKHGNTLQLMFSQASPFACPPLSSPSFMNLMCPMLKMLRLWDIVDSITASQFAAICQLSSLEHLSICPAGAGLQKVTSDVSKLVNLTILELHENYYLAHIHESISCLEKLESLGIHGSTLTKVPPGVARIPNLSSLEMSIQPGQGPLRFPRSLQGLKSLTSLFLPCCSLTTIPEVLTGLSALTRLHLSQNCIQSSNGGSWWPTTLSRLTNLVTLEMNRNHIVSLPPHISSLQQLQNLYVGYNELRTFPEELSRLQNLRVLWAGNNHLPSVPVSVLSSLSALTCINLSHQQCEGGAAFRISSSLLPILHPGLVELDVTQKGPWDPFSLSYLGHAKAEVAGRTPVPTLKYLSKS